MRSDREATTSSSMSKVAREGRKAGEAVRVGVEWREILICGSAMEVGVAANNIPGIRAGAYYYAYSLRLRSTRN